MVRNESEIAAQARRRRLFEGIYIPEVQQVFSVAAELFDRFEQAVVRLRCAALGVVLAIICSRQLSQTTSRV